MRADVASIKLKYLSFDPDRHGNPRWYVRVPGHPRHRMLAEYGTEAFTKEYWHVRENPPQRQVEHQTYKPGSLGWLVNHYYRSGAFHSLARATQKQQRSILNRICAENGHAAVAAITSRSIRNGRDNRRATPGAANNYLKTIKALFQWAIDEDRAETNPAIGVKRVPMNPDGHHTWTTEECARFEAAHPIGTTARLAYSLGLFAGLRRSDVVSIGRQHIRDGYLTLTQAKTGKPVSIRIIAPLRMALDAMPATDLHLIRTEYGRPFTAAGFGARFKKWTQQAGLPDRCTFHGLRKALGARSAELGLNESHIGAALGHTGTASAKVYTRGAEEKRLIDEAFTKLEQHFVALSNVAPEAVRQKQVKS